MSNRRVIETPTIRLRRSADAGRISPNQESESDDSGAFEHLSQRTNPRPQTYGPLPPLRAPVQTYHDIYNPLVGDEIRLVRLLPGYMSMIQCEMTHKSLQHASYYGYTGISYAWGDPDDTVDIRVNGSWMKVTASLHGALKALRKQDEAVLVWADAICINHSNKTEQSSQVQLMTQIYSRAESVMVWLGAQSYDSDMAIESIDALWQLKTSPEEAKSWIESKSHERNFDALHEDRLKLCFRPHVKNSRNRQSYAHVLVSGGPASIENLRDLEEEGAQSLLDVLRICRTKHATQPKDKVYGVLGILPEDVRSHLLPDYNASLRQVYTDVVDFLLHRTKWLDVICESIHFPLHTSSTALPTWVADWSYVQQMAGLGRSYGFTASGETEAMFSFPNDRRRTKLEISAIRIGAVNVRDIAVGTFCGLDDSLMAFLHWRAKMLANTPEDGQSASKGKWTEQDDAFCRTISFNQAAAAWQDLGENHKIKAWTDVCYHVFATLIAERLPSIRMDPKLQSCTEASIDVGDIVTGLDESRRIIQERCESRMMERCFFITDGGEMGMGTGFLEAEDIVCVPLGCCTPVILRPEGEYGEYRLVGDCYVDGYMDGEIIREWKENGGREPEPLVLR
ncbi:heterokaryon incompatibility protein-domain-containing protein [Apiospora rasikravindrae]|uniref:Heterokaryon incompatibility protein-domain-containing protein n=1 Tax=Apiospora rasikravindrae TaxID=990691 RepID=A0ABR1SK65_9PEZI